MAAQARVLLYGSDSLLFELGSVLTSFHHPVRYAKTFNGLVELLPDASVDLLIFCASVPQQESDRAMIFASTRCLSSGACASRRKLCRVMRLCPVSDFPLCQALDI